MLLIELACQHCVRVLLDLLPSCHVEPSRIACLTYLLLIFGSSSWVSGRPWTVVWRFRCVWFLSRCDESPPCPPITLQDKGWERCSSWMLFFSQILVISLFPSLVLHFWHMCSQRWLRNNALTNRSGAGRLCASGKQGMFPGVAAFRKQRKSYFTAQWMQAGLQFECCWFCNLPTPCQIKLLNSSSSVHSFLLPTPGKNNLN